MCDLFGNIKVELRNFWHCNALAGTICLLAGVIATLARYFIADLQVFRGGVAKFLFLFLFARVRFYIRRRQTTVNQVEDFYVAQFLL